MTQRDDEPQQVRAGRDACCRDEEVPPLQRLCWFDGARAPRPCESVAEGEHQQHTEEPGRARCGRPQQPHVRDERPEPPGPAAGIGVDVLDRWGQQHHEHQAGDQQPQGAVDGVAAKPFPAQRSGREQARHQEEQRHADERTHDGGQFEQAQQRLTDRWLAEHPCALQCRPRHRHVRDDHPAHEGDFEVVGIDVTGAGGHRVSTSRRSIGCPLDVHHNPPHLHATQHAQP
jgi:hypothetical protein